MSKILTWNEVVANNLPYDASGINDPKKCAWKESNGVYHPIQTVDCTPTWQAALRIYLAAYDNGGSKGRESAIEGLSQMAAVAQRYVEQMNSEFILQIDGDPDSTCTLGRFIIDNSIEKGAGGLDPDEICRVSNLQLGQEISFGGGAAAITTLKRIQ